VFKYQFVVTAIFLLEYLIKTYVYIAEFWYHLPGMFLSLKIMMV